MSGKDKQSRADRAQQTSRSLDYAASQDDPTAGAADTSPNPQTANPAVLPVSAQRALQVLARGKVRERGLLPYSSNHSFLVVVHDGDLQLPAVYKPQRGESPLWDFEWGTLCKRETAAWTISEVLGWNLVPPTVLRGASRGLGSVQFYIDHEAEAHYFSVQSDARYVEQLRQLVLFDYITNNADRKSGHCLLGNDGRLWAIDHGLCFHAEYKLRTVIWEFSGEPIAPALLLDMQRLSDLLERVQLDRRAELADEEDLESSEANSSETWSVDFDRRRDAAQGDTSRLQTDSQGESTQSDQAAITLDASQHDLVASLCGLLSPQEERALGQRVRTLLRKGSYPTPLPQRRNYPWPPV